MPSGVGAGALFADASSGSLDSSNAAVTGSAGSATDSSSAWRSSMDASNSETGSTNPNSEGGSGPVLVTIAEAVPNAAPSSTGARVASPKLSALVRPRSIQHGSSFNAAVGASAVDSSSRAPIITATATETQSHAHSGQSVASMDFQSTQSGVRQSQLGSPETASTKPDLIVSTASHDTGSDQIGVVTALATPQHDQRTPGHSDTSTTGWQHVAVGSSQSHSRAPLPRTAHPIASPATGAVAGFPSSPSKQSAAPVPSNITLSTSPRHSAFAPHVHPRSPIVTSLSAAPAVSDSNVTAGAASAMPSNLTMADLTRTHVLEPFASSASTASISSPATASTANSAVTYGQLIASQAAALEDASMTDATAAAQPQGEVSADSSKSAAMDVDVPAEAPDASAS